MTIAVVSTGGTIAMASDQEDGASPELSGADLVAAVPGLGDVADVTIRDVANLPSAHFTVDQMMEIVDVVRDLDADPEVDGVVVTQGTDVLEESAYFVDLCYDGETPVAFTGAMRNATMASPDGPGNLLASARTVTDPGASDAGVLAVFNDRVLPAREVRKTHSTVLDTFRAPEFGPLAVVEEGRVTWRRRPVNPDSTFDPAPGKLTNDVHAVTVTVDMTPAQLRAAADSAALCIAVTGAGHIPTTIIPAIEDLRDRGVPVVATTRCTEGRLARDTYDFSGSEQTLRELGCLFGDLPLAKIRVRTIVALAADALDEAFDSP